MTEAEIKKLFKQAGWIIDTGAKHDMAVNPKTGVKIPIPRHKGDIPKGTAHRMLKEAGIKP